MITATLISTKPCLAPNNSLPVPATAAGLAVSAMTDFTVTAPASVSENRQIDTALDDMRQAGVRAFIVANGREVTGLITARDILGDKPTRFIHSHFRSGKRCTYEDIVVADIMAPLGWLETLELCWVEQATAAELIAVFEDTRSTHLLVMEPGNQGGIRQIRGLISRARVDQQ